MEMTKYDQSFNLDFPVSFSKDSVCSGDLHTNSLSTTSNVFRKQYSYWKSGDLGKGKEYSESSLGPYQWKMDFLYLLRTLNFVN